MVTSSRRTEFSRSTSLGFSLGVGAALSRLAAGVIASGIITELYDLDLSCLCGSPQVDLYHASLPVKTPHNDSPAWARSLLCLRTASRTLSLGVDNDAGRASCPAQGQALCYEVLTDPYQARK